MRRILLLCALCLSGCSGTGDGKPTRPSWGEPESASISVEALVAERRPDYPLSRYSDYPEAIRALLQRREIEDELCHGYGAQALRACNRRDFAIIALERRGWCEGRRALGSEEIWLPCRESVTHEPGRLEAVGPSFSDVRIAGVDDQYRHMRGQPRSRELPVLMRQLWAAADQALTAPIADADLRRFSLARYEQYPAAIRPLLQRFDLEDRRCRIERVSGGSEGLRACNRKAYAEIVLERSGWCLAEQGGWALCGKGPGYVPGERSAFRHINSDALIRWTEERERRQRSEIGATSREVTGP